VAASHTVVPADPSAAAFWLVAGACHPDAELTLRGVDVNPTRRAGIDLLRRMGAEIEERPPSSDDAGNEVGTGDAVRAGDRRHATEAEPVADLVVRSSNLHAIEVSPAEAAAAIDELPILCLAASQARGRTTIHGAGELRVKESDRLSGIATGLTTLGARVEVDGDDLLITGPTRLRGGTVDARADHRLAMTFAIAALLATADTRIGGASSAVISDPRFFGELERIRS